MIDSTRSHRGVSGFKIEPKMQDSIEMNGERKDCAYRLGSHI